MNKLQIILATDGYKLGHKDQYPKGTNLVFANFTPRKSLHPWIKDYVISYGVKYVFQKIEEDWVDVINNTSWVTSIENIKIFVEKYLGISDYDIKHFNKLFVYIQRNQKLPIKVMALPDYTKVKFGVPIFTIWNTEPEFYWLVNYLETRISADLWPIITSATISHEYREIGKKFLLKTDEENMSFLDYQFHDFSMRGMIGVDGAIKSGIGHMAFSKGTDTIPAVIEAQKYNLPQSEGYGVNATEHSVMCAGGKENELETFERLLDLYPTGTLSIVSDTWDLWNVLDNILPKLKDKILARDGKLVIRPDSGDPEDIVCGNTEQEGVVQKLWNVFGGTTNYQGFKVLNEKVGVIYGDSITLDRAWDIFCRLDIDGFASSNIVLGIGSFTYQYNTRDTFGFAMKTTYIEVNGEPKNLFKDPITDDGTKKSAKGLLAVIDGELVQETTWEIIKSDKNEMISI